MKEEFPIPAVIVNSDSEGAEALVGLEMTSITGAEALKESGKKRDDKEKCKREKMFDAMEAFMRLLTAWSDNIALELHWSAIPDMQSPSRGIIWITLFLRVTATDRQTAVSDAIQGCFRLRPLLSTYFKHISFTPVMEEEELKKRYCPFEAKSGIEVRRVEKHIALSSPIQHTPMGFGDIKPVSAKAELLRHKYPWAPTPNVEDLLPKALMARMDPIRFIVRIGRESPLKESSVPSKKPSRFVKTSWPQAMGTRSPYPGRQR